MAKAITVYQYTKELELVKEHRSIRQSQLSVGVIYGSKIRKCMKGEIETAYGYIWTEKEIIKNEPQVKAFMEDEEDNKYFTEIFMKAHARLKEFGFDIIEDMEVLVKEPPMANVAGWYEVSTKRVHIADYVIKSRRSTFLEEAIYHEVGHWVHYNKLDCYQFNLPTKGKSRYAEVNFKENFAEAFMDLMMGHDKPERNAKMEIILATIK